MLRVGWFALSVTVSHLKCRRCWESFFGPWVCWERSGGSRSGKTETWCSEETETHPSCHPTTHNSGSHQHWFWLQLVFVHRVCVTSLTSAVPQRGQTEVPSVAVDLCAVGRRALAAVFIGVHIVQSGTVSVRPHPWHWSGRVAHTLVWRTSSNQWMGGQSHSLCLSQRSLLCTGTRGGNAARDPGAGPKDTRYPPLLSSYPSSPKPLRP